MDDEKPRETALGTALPAHNFTITTAERVRALASGPLAYMRRLRTIEDLEVSVVRALRDLDAPELDDLARGELERRVARDFARMIDLVARHNRWYPREADLPLDPTTGRYVDRGAPWTPRPTPTMDALIARKNASRR